MEDITLYEGANELNVQLAPVVVPIAGSIYPGLIWSESLELWQNITPGMGIALNEEITVSPEWLNDSEIDIVGHVDLVVTYPDSTQHTLSAVLNQDKEAAPNNGWHVQFAPFLSSQEGTYTLMATLSSGGQFLDSVAFTLVAVVALANLYGVVADAQTLQALPGVIVTLDGRVVVTDASGQYLFEGLAPGGYTATFEKEGYETEIR